MFDIAPTELLLVAFVALVVIGPKDLPKAMRVVGYWVGRARGVARQFRSGFDQMVREAELEEMEKRWAAENERIMREHPQTDATTEPAGSDDPAGTGGTDHAAGISPESVAADAHAHPSPSTADADTSYPSASDQGAPDPAPADNPAVERPAGEHDDDITRPVMVEKPQIVPAADPTPHRSEGAPS